jgi:hypothetical protein
VNEAQRKAGMTEEKKKLRIKANEAQRKLNLYQRTQIKDRFKAFKNATLQGPSFACLSCERLMFFNGITQISVEKITKNKTSQFLDLLFAALPIHNITPQQEIQLCHNCKNNFMKNQIPGLNFTNGLEIDVLPGKLTGPEESLCALNILFAKIFQLPTTRIKGIVDKIVNVPISEEDLSHTAQILPRNTTEASIILLKFKRKKEYKNSVSESYIRPNVVLESLKYLKIHNPFYSNVQLNTNTNAPIEEMDTTEDPTSMPNETEEEEQEENAQEQSEKDEDYYKNQDPVRKYQHNIADSFVLTPSDPETDLVTNFAAVNLIIKTSDGKDFVIAPGEGKVPTNFLRADNWDVKGFPTLHATGKFGMHYAREKKLYPQQYFCQRLLNRNRIFSKHSQFLFAAVYFTERYQIENQINISYKRGKVSNNDGQNQLSALEDGFSVLQKIKGTPKYWQTKRFSLIAQQEVQGPFQFFFTLSCADKRWSEIYTTILAQNGHKVVYATNPEEDTTIDGIPLHEYLQTENVHKLAQEDVLTITRIFDHRVKMFIKHVAMGKGSPMKIVNYTYRVEFQARGMAHVHGVLWCDLTQEERTAFNYIFKSNFSSKDAEYETLVCYIDKFITCEIPAEENLQKIVLEVQKHNHTKSCKKYENQCR